MCLSSRTLTLRTSLTKSPSGSQAPRHSALSSKASRYPSTTCRAAAAPTTSPQLRSSPPCRLPSDLIISASGVSSAPLIYPPPPPKRQTGRAYPREQLHVVVDNYHTHKHAEVDAWLAKRPRITLHFTPTSGSCLNLIEVFFGIITRKRSDAAHSATSKISPPRSADSSMLERPLAPIRLDQNRRRDPAPHTHRQRTSETRQ